MIYWKSIYKMCYKESVYDCNNDFMRIEREREREHICRGISSAGGCALKNRPKLEAFRWETTLIPSTRSVKRCNWVSRTMNKFECDDEIKWNTHFVICCGRRFGHYRINFFFRTRNFVTLIIPDDANIIPSVAETGFDVFH